MSLSLGQAAVAVGMSKPTIQRAIKTGKLSAGRNEDGSIPIADPASTPLAGATAVTRPSSRAAVNRQAMPVIAGVVDQFRRVFGADQVRVVFAEEAGQRLGTAPATSKEGQQ